MKAFEKLVMLFEIPSNIVIVITSIFILWVYLYLYWELCSYLY